MTFRIWCKKRIIIEYFVAPIVLISDYYLLICCITEAIYGHIVLMTGTAELVWVEVLISYVIQVNTSILCRHY